MKKTGFSVVVLSALLSALLSACSAPSAGPHSRSGVQVYGTINTGVGHTRQTITTGDGSKTTRTSSGMRSY